tara:strand:- start:287 stop:514 length:228 start_codon:yes stop_codon:yes gene_type:complete
MLLYTEKQLDKAYRIDCKSRTKSNNPWIQREDFRPIYERIIELYMKNENYMFVEDVPDWVAESINEILETTLTVD